MKSREHKQKRRKKTHSDEKKNNPPPPKKTFFTSSPFIIATDDPQRELLDPALCGTVNVLTTAAKEQERRRKAEEEEEEGGNKKSRRRRRPLRVVLTSSVAAVHGEYAAPPTNGQLYSEEDWNETSTVSNGQAYHLSKAMAEKEAWKVAGAKRIDLVTVCPNFVQGPPAISSREHAAAALKGSLSVGYVKDLIEGAKPAGGKPIICDVRDVARAHVAAAEKPEAKGRYIVSQAGSVLPRDMRAAIVDALVDLGFEGEAESLPAAEEPLEGAGVARIDASRTAAELGVRARPAAETLRDAARALVKLGVAVPASKVGETAKE